MWERPLCQQLNHARSQLPGGLPASHTVLYWYIQSMSVSNPHPCVPCPVCIKYLGVARALTGQTLIPQPWPCRGSFPVAVIAGRSGRPLDMLEF